MTELIEYIGHIRNHEALCAQLDLPAGLSREQREKQIITKGYEKWGKALPEHLYGMFAFCIKDGEKLYCVRDHFGTKPYYYYLTDDRNLLCGTSIRDIIKQQGFKKELNADMLQIYMSLTYVAGEDTFFKGLKKLMPGCYLEFEGGKLSITRYWRTGQTRYIRPLRR